MSGYPGSAPSVPEVASKAKAAQESSSQYCGTSKTTTCLTHGFFKRVAYIMLQMMMVRHDEHISTNEAVLDKQL